MNLRTLWLVGILLLLCWTGRLAGVQVGEGKEPIYQGKSLSAWIAELQNQDASKRRAAVAALRQIGPPAKAAVAALVATLKDQDDEVAVAAAWSLMTIDRGQRKVVVPFLQNYLKSGKKETWGATYLLADIASAQAQAAVPFLIKKVGFGYGSDSKLARDLLLAIGAEAVPGLTAALKDKSPYIRYGAATVLRGMGSPAKTVIPALRELLQDPDLHVRRHAARELFFLDRPRAKDLIPAFSAALLELPGEYVYFRAEAAAYLGKMGTEAKAAVPALSTALKDNRWEVRSAAAKALGQIGPAAREAIPALTVLAARFQGEYPWDAAYAAAALVRIDPAQAKVVLPALATIFSGEGKQRGFAGEALVRIGPAAVPVLVAALQDKTETKSYLRRDAARSLDEIGPGAKEALPALRAALQDQSWEVRIQVVKALKQIAPAEMPAVVKFLENALQGKNPPHYQTLVEEIVAIGPAARSLVPRLLPSILPELKAKSELSRQRAAQALRELGPSAAAAAADLGASLQDPDVQVRYAAARALSQLGPAAKAALLGLQAAVKDQNSNVQLEVVQALGNLGQEAAVPALQAALQDKSYFVRVAVVQALGKLGPMAVPALQAALQDKESLVREKVVWTLGKMGPAAKAALPALRAVHQKDPSLKVPAAVALANIDPATAKTMIPVLVTCLDEDDSPAAAQALADLGPAAREAVPALRALQQTHPQNQVRRAATRALAKIAPQKASK